MYHWFKTELIPFICTIPWNCGKKLHQMFYSQYLTVTFPSGLSCFAFTRRIFHPRKTDCSLVLQVQHSYHFIRLSDTLRYFRHFTTIWLVTFKLETQIARTRRGKIVNCKYKYMQEFQTELAINFLKSMLLAIATYCCHLGTILECALE